MATDSKGYTTIPASRRPDGTWRKERKVKEGYVPPDEVERYQSKGKKWADETPKLPPGVYEDPTPQTKLTKNQKKNERKKQKRREKAEQKEDTLLKEKDTQDSCLKNESSLQQVSTSIETLSVNSDNKPIKDERTKKIKALRKKVRQIEELERKIKDGELKTLEKDQKEKVKKKQVFLDELSELELED